MANSMANKNSAFDVPNYQYYSLKELEDVLQNIDKHQYPERYVAAQAAFEVKKASSALKEEKRVRDSNNSSNCTDGHFEKSKWSKLHVVARYNIALLIVLFVGLFVPLSADFSTVKTWVDNSGWFIVLLSLVVTCLWYASIAVDEAFRFKLNDDIRGKITIFLMPFFGIMLSWNAIDNALPYMLHALSSSEETEHAVLFSKGSATKHCKFNLQLEDTQTHSHSRLCVNKSVFNRLSKKGTVVLKGNESAFGFTIESYRFH